MQLRHTLMRSLYVLLVIIPAAVAWSQPAAVAPPSATGIRFVENKGQVVNTLGKPAPDVLYTAQGKGMKIFFRKTGLSYVFVRIDGVRAPGRPTVRGGGGAHLPEPDTAMRIAAYRMDMDLVGANPRAEVTGEDQGGGLMNFYLGHCPNGVTGVRAYGRIIYHDIYPDIDLVFYSANGGLKYDFVVRPGGRASDIRLRYTGADSLRSLPDGRIVVANPLGTLTEGKPLLYQTKGALRAGPIPAGADDVGGRYGVDGRTLTFDVGRYDRARPLVIDPSLLWCTYLGGSGFEYNWTWGWWGGGGGGGMGWGTGSTCVLDSNGNLIYITLTGSVDFPATPGAVQTLHSGMAGIYDVAVSKFDARGSRIWSTYYGGTGNDYGSSVKVDPFGNILFSGTMQSGNFPVTAGAFATAPALPSLDGFLVKLDSAGARQWATFTGGGYCYGLTSDRAGNIFVGGQANWLMQGTAGTFSSTPPPLNKYSGFISMFSPAGARVWNTFIGGTPTAAANDAVTCLATDNAGNLFVAGGAATGTFPVTNGAFQNGVRGMIDMFAARFDPTGNRVWATLYGGSATEMPSGICVDTKGNMIVAGSTESADLPTTPFAYRTTLAGTSDPFLAKFAGGSGVFLYGSYYGGSSWDYTGGVDIDRHNNVWCVGYTVSSDFPVTADAFQSSPRDPIGGTADGYIMKIDSTGGLGWSTYFGGNNWEYADGIAVNHLGCYVGGSTYSFDLPITTGAFQATPPGSYDSFLAQFCDPMAPLSVLRPTTFCQGDSTVLSVPRGFDFYRWSNGASGRSITITQSGTYSVIVSAGNCTVSSEPIDVTVHPLPRRVIGAIGSTNICQGDSVTLSIGGGMRSYQWSNGSFAPTITIREPGRFSVAFIDSNGCASRSDTINVTLSPRPFPTITMSGPLTFCEGDNVVLDAGPGYAAYRWTNGDSAQRITVTKSGTYNVHVMNASGCWNDAQNVAVKVYSAPKVKINPILPTIFCEGDSTVLSATSGFVSYQWSSGERTPRVTLKKDGRYTLVVTDSNGCRATAEVMIQVTRRPMPRILASGPLRFCKGDSVLLTVPGGFSQYQWASGQQSQSIVVKQSGLYYVLASNDYGCAGVSDTVMVQVFQRPSIAIAGPSSVCSSSLSTYSVPNRRGLSYLWLVSGGGGSIISGEGTNEISVQWGVSGTGTIALNVHNDSTGCSADTSFTVEVGSGLTPVVTADGPLAFCAGGSVTLDAGAYDRYIWSNGATTRTITVAQPGDYTVAVVDARGCSGRSAPVAVAVNPAPVPAVIAEKGGKLCPGDQLALAATPGYARYVWSNGALGEKIMVRQEGSYTVTVTDSNGCTGVSDPVDVELLPVPEPAINGPVVVCHNSTIGYSTPNVPGTIYTWSVNGGTLLSGQGTNAIRVAWGDLVNGTVDLSVTTPRGCSGIARSCNVAIGDKLEPVITPGGTVALCKGGAVTLDAGAGFASYQWSTGETTQTITVADAASVTVSVTDSNGCTGSSAPVRLEVKPVPEPVITPSGGLELCAGDSVVLDAGAGYAHYAWPTGSTKRTITVKQGGAYAVQVTSADGCDGAAEAVTVTYHSLPDRPIISARGDTLHAGPGPFYQWMLDGVVIEGATSESLVAAASGTYSVTVRNALGCGVASDPFALRVGPLAIKHFVWLDTVSARVGDRVHLVMRISPELVASDSVAGYHAVLRVDPNAIFFHHAISPDAASTGDPATMHYTSDGRLTIDRPATSAALTGSELVRLEFEGLVTGRPENLIAIESLALTGPGPVAIAGDGRVILSGCEVGSSIGKRVRIESIRPNPIAADAVVSYRAPAGGEVTLRLMDVSGGQQRTITLPAGTGQTQEVHVVIDGIASGVYMLELRNGGERSMLPIVVRK